MAHGNPDLGLKEKIIILAFQNQIGEGLCLKNR